MFYRLEIFGAWPNILDFKNLQSWRNLTKIDYTNHNIMKQQIWWNKIYAFQGSFKIGIFGSFGYYYILILFVRNHSLSKWLSQKVIYKW